VPIKWQGQWTVATASVKACYCDDDETEKSK
jgi:hypothetical protein